MGFKDYCRGLPEPEDLLKKHPPSGEVPEVNGHLHTPWSFCSFESIPQMFEMAVKENVRVLGINDFFTVDGYGEFEANALRSRVYPLFNIEFMGLLKDLQAADIKVNDPNNPGRIYFSGKALEHPLNVSAENRFFLENIQANSQLQVRQMCEKTEAVLREKNSPFSIGFEQVREDYARNIVRERHIARALREAVYAAYPSEEEKRFFFREIFDGKDLVPDVGDLPAVENEIRSMLLKKGGRAFVPEDEDTFPDLKRIIEFILDAGGIPCYPVLLDDRKGNIITEFESDWDLMDEVLRSFNVFCIELIPSRNSLGKLLEFVRYFEKKNYLISFGTEHNTPALFPVEVKADGNKDLPDELRVISYRGICVLAAHQYLVATGMDGFVNYDGKADTGRISYLRELGHALISELCGNQFN